MQEPSNEVRMKCLIGREREELCVKSVPNPPLAIFIAVLFAKTAPSHPLERSRSRRPESQHHPVRRHTRTHGKRGTQQFIVNFFNRLSSEDQVRLSPTVHDIRSTSSHSVSTLKGRATADTTPPDCFTKTAVDVLQELGLVLSSPLLCLSTLRPLPLREKRNEEIQEFRVRHHRSLQSTKFQQLRLILTKGPRLQAPTVLRMLRSPFMG